MTREEALAVSKPILFNTEMVQAIQDNRKSVTRRVVKIKEHGKEGHITGRPKWGVALCPDGRYFFNVTLDNVATSTSVAPPYQPGDILYVRETWVKIGGNVTALRYAYKADNERFAPRWRPSIHMPKEAARIFLRVTDVRVERLQDMRLVDCLAEGVVLSSIEKMDFIKGPHIARGRYAGVWDSTIPKKDLDLYGWDANPWVWVIEFERVEVQ